jgi:hypothetical protein
MPSIIISLFLTAPAIAKHDKEKRLPPGLQKKLERGGELPSGWQKKLVEGQIIDSDLYRHARILSPADIYGREIIQLDDKTMRIIRATREIVHIFGQ